MMEKATDFKISGFQFGGPTIAWTLSEKITNMQVFAQVSSLYLHF
jgi:hypothetical protein